MSKLKVTSREYKVMLHHDRIDSIKVFWEKLKKYLPEFQGELELTKQRTVSFLDTKYHELRTKNFVLRKRVDDEVQYTLKRRSPDLYIATGIKVGETWKKKRDKFEVKLEEDISPPFRSRYSYSGTYTTDEQRELFDIREAATIFKPLQRFDEWSQLEVVGGTVLESVYKGGEINLGREMGEVAVVEWRHVDDVVVAEFSFRYQDKKGKFLYPTARNAKKAFDHLQNFSWTNPVGITKTQYIYDEPSWLMGVMEHVT